MTTSATSTSQAGEAPAPDAPPGRRRRVPPNLVFLGKRAATYLVVFFVSVVLNFVLPRLMPNDPAQSMIRDIYEKTGQRPSDGYNNLIQTASDFTPTKP